MPWDGTLSLGAAGPCPGMLKSVVLKKGGVRGSAILSVPSSPHRQHLSRSTSTVSPNLHVHTAVNPGALGQARRHPADTLPLPAAALRTRLRHVSHPRAAVKGGRRIAWRERARCHVGPAGLSSIVASLAHGAPPQGTSSGCACGGTAHCGRFGTPIRDAAGPLHWAL